MKINEKQFKFVESYLITGNATESYLSVYPKAKYDTAKTNGARLLTNANIQEYIRSKQQITAERNNISKDEIISVLASIIRNEDNRNGDRIKAIETTAKLLGLNAPTETNINMNLEQPLFGDE